MIGIQPSTATGEIVKRGLDQRFTAQYCGGDTIRVLPPLVMTLEQAGELGAGIATFSTTSPARKTTHDCAKTLSHPDGSRAR